MTTLQKGPCFSPEAQEVFTSGARVFVREHVQTLEDFEREAGFTPEVLGGAEGTFLGWIGDDPHSPQAAVVEWDDLGQRESDFDNLRNLYR